MPTATSRAKIGLGTKVEFTQSGSIGEVVDTIEGLGWERADYEATHMDVPEVDGVVKANRIKIPSTLVGVNDVTLTLHFDPALGLPVALPDPERINFIFPRRRTEAIPAKWSCMGYVKSVSQTNPVDGKMMARVVIGFSGDYAYTKPTLVA